jgi:enhancing lycopene biosynthesis protein 2
MTSTEKLAKLLSEASPEGAKARAVVIETARIHRFMIKGITRQKISELDAVSVLFLSGKNAPEWAVAYHFELDSAIRAMTKGLIFQQVNMLYLYSGLSSFILYYHA